jgi:Na+-transporting NADH:ubiquinone oxidoreductase subunit F
LRIQLTDPLAISFIAGQFIRFDSKEYNGKPPVTRTYSLASVPSDSGHVELIIRRVPEGICTTWVFDHLAEGDTVTFAGPYGKFKVSETSVPMLFIAGGSGMAPIWSMLRDMKENGTNRTTRYFFGAQTQNDLYFTQELFQLQNELPDFRFIPALSREPENSGWAGERGKITDVVARHIPDASGHEAYLCGSPGMIETCVATLQAIGIATDKIYYDKFA